MKSDTSPSTNSARICSSRSSLNVTSAAPSSYKLFGIDLPRKAVSPRLCAGRSSCCRRLGSMRGWEFICVLSRGCATRRGKLVWCWRGLQTRQQPIDRRDVAVNRCAFVVSQRYLLQHPHHVRFGADEVGPRRLPRDIEVAARTGHPMRALIEELVGAEPVAKIIIAPGLT